MLNFTMQDLLKLKENIKCIANIDQPLVIVSELACEPVYENVKRTLKERLSERPFHPFVKFKSVMKQNNPKIYYTELHGDRYVICHPLLEKTVREFYAKGT